MSTVTKIILSALVLLLAIYYGDIQRTATIMGLYRTVLPYDGGKCAIIKGPEGCEDIVIHHESGHAIMACGSFVTRVTQGWAPLGPEKNMSYVTHEQPWLYNINTGEIFPLTFKNWDDPEMNPHGLGIYVDPEKPNVPVLFFINHKRTGSVIEIFEHEIGSTELNHVKTVEHELIRTPNSVEPISRNEFYITNDHLYKTGWKRQIEETFLEPWSDVVFYSGVTNTARVVVENMIFPNGVAVNWDKSQVYIASSYGELFIYERRQDGRLVEQERIDAEILIDNVSVDDITGEIYIAAVPSGFKLMRKVKSYPLEKSYKVPIAVIKVSNNTGQDKYFGKKYNVVKVLEDDGSNFEMVTIAAVDRRRNAMLLSGLYMDGIVRCDLE